jgi:3-phenylpropionate/trans-cinnamate dioxygenase ferredoxin subunit
LSDSSFTDLAGLDELPEKGFIVRPCNGTEVVLCKYKDEIYAVENRCSHAFATFDDGRLRGNRLMCPLHGACFNVCDGKPFGPPASTPIRTYAVRVVDDRVFVAVDSPA